MHGADERDARTFLRRCALLYEALVAHVLRLETRGHDETILKWIGLAAEVAWVAHPGRYADGRLESVALRVGKRLEPLSAASAEGPRRSRTAGRRRVLHVATTVYETGGHTRLIENWIKSDDVSTHSLALLDQQKHAIRPELAGLVGASGGELMVLPADASLLERSRRLRAAAQSYDFVVLHHHPSDVVPLVAFATDGGPPVALMNHADHVFWLGSAVADAVIDFRHFGAKLSRERRSTRQTLMFPLPLDLGSKPLDRAEARARLGIDAAEIVLFSMGSPYKYVPTRTHDFFRALYGVLERNPAARLYVVGVSEEDLRTFGTPRHERMVLLGVVSDPSLHEAAADLYLESFPYGSYTALLQTAARGICPVLMYSPISHTRIAPDIPLQGMVENAVDEADYISAVTALIGDRQTRTKLGRQVAAQVAAIHATDMRGTYLEPIYDRLAATSHRAAAPPIEPATDTEDDLALAVSNLARAKTTVMQQVADTILGRLTVGETLRLLGMSIRSGDTRLRPSDARAWMRIAKQRSRRRAAVRA